MNKDKFIAEKLGVCTHPRKSFGLNKKLELICGICKEVVYDDKFDVCPDFTSEGGRVRLLKLIEKSPYKGMLQYGHDLLILWLTNDTGAFRDSVYRQMNGLEAPNGKQAL